MTVSSLVPWDAPIYHSPIRRVFASSLERLAALPPETRVLPGHGPETTIARERATNPFLVGFRVP